MKKLTPLFLLAALLSGCASSSSEKAPPRSPFLGFWKSSAALDRSMEIQDGGMFVIKDERTDGNVDLRMGVWRTSDDKTLKLTIARPGGKFETATLALTSTGELVGSSPNGPTLTFSRVKGPAETPPPPLS